MVSEAEVKLRIRRVLARRFEEQAVKYPEDSKEARSFREAIELLRTGRRKTEMTADVMRIAKEISWPDLVEAVRDRLPGCAEMTVEKLYMLQPDEAEAEQRVKEISPALDSVTTAVVVLRLIDLGELLGAENWAVATLLPLIEKQMQPEAAKIIRQFATQMLKRLPEGSRH